MVLAPWQLGKNTRTSRENHQIEYSLNTDRRCRLKTLAATAGFVGAERAVAQGDGNRALPDRRAGAGPAAGGRGRAGVRGAGALRRRRRADGPRRPRLRAARARRPCAADPPPARRHRHHHGTAARLRADRARQGSVHQRRCPAGVFDQHRTGFGVDQGSAGRVLSAVGRKPARRSRRDRHPASGRRAVSVLRHPVDHLRHPGPDRIGLFRLLRDPGPPQGEAGGSFGARSAETVEDKLADRYGRRR